MERNNNSSYTQKEIEIGVRITGEIALGNAAYKILVNIILEKIKPYIEKITGDYQKGFREVRPVRITRTIRVNRLHWFGHAQRMQDKRIPKKKYYI